MVLIQSRDGFVEPEDLAVSGSSLPGVTVPSWLRIEIPGAPGRKIASSPVSDRLGMQPSVIARNNWTVT